MQTTLAPFIDARDVPGALKQVREGIGEFDVKRALAELPGDRDLPFYGHAAYLYALILKIKAGRVLTTQEERDYERALELFRQRRHRASDVKEEAAEAVVVPVAESRYAAQETVEVESGNQFVLFAKRMLGDEATPEMVIELERVDLAEAGKTILGLVYKRLSTTYTELCQTLRFSQNERLNKVVVLVSLLHLAQETDERGQALLQLQQAETFGEIHVSV